MAMSRRLAVGLWVALCGAGMAGCSSIQDDVGDIFAVLPASLTYYNCKDIEDRIKATRARHTELEQLMVRTARGAGGDAVNAIVYRTEYRRAEGDLKVLATVASEKRCASEGQLSSSRAIF